MKDDYKDYDDTPAGQYRRWNAELASATQSFKRWVKEAEKTVKKFTDERTQEQDEWGEMTTRLNLFHANVTTLTAMLYGKIPKVEVARKFADADDDVARVAGEMLTRILNTDIEEAGEDMASVFRNGLQDRLIPGMGNARVQYHAEFSTVEHEALIGDYGEELAPAFTEHQKGTEWVDILYTHWKDILWSPARTYPEIRWKAYRSYLSKRVFCERFPKIDVKRIAFSTKGNIMKQRGEKQSEVQPQVEVWEIWDKENECVYWYTEGYEEILDHQDDPLGLEGFFPDAPPFIANVTTSKYIPKSDYSIVQDLYRDIDKLQTRISLLTDACKLVGVYDKTNEGIKRIFTEGVENDLIPVDNWAMFAEKGGLKGTIDWIPLETVANTIQVLVDKQTNRIQQLYQVTGMNDVMRGAAMTSDRTSATRDQLEATYGSIRVEALQNEFARWVSDLQMLKVEIIAQHYDAKTIIEQSNIMATPDAQLAMQAVALIKNQDSFRWRVTVRPESLAIADYAQLKQDRTEYINALALFMQSAAPLLELDPTSLPTLLQLLKWGLAGFKGSAEIEGVIDQAIARLQKQPPQQKQDPQAQAAAQKAEAEQQKIQMEMQQSAQEHQQNLQQTAQDHALKLQQVQEKHAQEMKQNQQEFSLRIMEMQQAFKLDMTQMLTDMVTSIRKQAAAAQAGMLEKEHAAQVQMESADHAARRNNGKAE